MNFKKIKFKLKCEKKGKKGERTKQNKMTFKRWRLNGRNLHWRFLCYDSFQVICSFCMEKKCRTIGSFSVSLVQAGNKNVEES